jgi:hypothetical protein
VIEGIQGVGRRLWVAFVHRVGEMLVEGRPRISEPSNHGCTCGYPVATRRFSGSLTRGEVPDTRQTLR